MTGTARPWEGPYEESLRQGQIKYALKTALACCLAASLTHFFHLASGVFAALFAFMLMTLGMPIPRLSAILGHFWIVGSSLVSALLVIAFHDVPFLYLSMTLLWIFTCQLFANWFFLPASMGSMVSAIGLFVFFTETVGDTFTFYVNFGLDWLVGGSSVVMITTLIWPHSIEKVLIQRLAAGYSHLEGQCQQTVRSLRLRPEQTARQIQAAASLQGEISLEELELAPLPTLRQVPAPELPGARDTSNPLARMNLACRAMNLHLWFFRQAVVPVLPALPAETCRQLAGMFAQCAEHLNALIDGLLHTKQIPPVDAELLREACSARWAANFERGRSVHHLLDQGIHQSLVCQLIQDLQTVTTSHNSLLPSLRGGLAGELSAIEASATGPRLIDVNSLRRSTKLVLILLLCLMEQHAISFPGGVQVAFFAVFFASIGNVGRQSKTDLLGLLGILAAWAFGIAAAFITSKLPRFPLVLSLTFLFEFLAILVYAKLPRYGIVGLQAGLAFSYAYLERTGPGWETFEGVRTRLMGIIVAGFTALVVHTFLWPVLPMRRLRTLTAAALRETAVSLSQLFSAPSTWKGSPSSLHSIVTQAHELIDDARYLPGPDSPHPNYFDVVGCLQEIEACLQYVNLRVAQKRGNPLLDRFFQVLDDYAEQAGSKLEEVAQHFQQSPGHTICMEPVRWQPNVSARWQRASEDVAPIPDGEIDSSQLAVVAQCLDQIAREVERISGIAFKINA